MVVTNELQTDALESIAFVGDALAPLFLEDPRCGSAGPSFEAFSQLDVNAAAEEWPFAQFDRALEGLELMVDGLADGVSEEQVWEYRRLFVGPGRKAAAPWGSVYTDHEGVIFGEATLALRSWMRANGVKRLAAEGDPDDHIGLMLALMAWLACNRPELLCEYLRNHLLTWAPHYLEGLEHESAHPFYKGLAVLTAGTLDGMREALGIAVQQPRFYR